MTEEEKKKAAADAQAKKDAEEKAAKADADAGEKLDKVLACMDSVSKRMDAFEDKFKKSDGEEDDTAKIAADKAKKDAEEEEEKKKADAAKRKDEPGDNEDMAERIKAKEKEKADAAAAADAAAKADSESIRKRIDDVERMLPKHITDADYASMADAQARYDGVFSLFGDAASRPLQGETPLAYRRRLAGTLKVHSKNWKEVDLATIADDATFAIVEGQVLADAQAAALAPSSAPEGELRPVRRRDPTGRTITEYVGHPSAWMNQFGVNRRRLTGIRNSRTG